jgi:formate/nitrite transporter FocA (FNT family)
MPAPEKVREEAEERSAPPASVVYEAIYLEGKDELGRGASALFFSALAAGLSMGFSLITEALICAALPDTPWRALICKFGYSVGFLIVVLARQQLFTENTLTPILPLLQHRSWKTFLRVSRLWAIVLFANLVGAAAVAVIAGNSTAFDPEVRKTFAEMGRAEMQYGFATTMLRGVFAGWLLALMVWLLPFAEQARIWVIVAITYLVGLGNFSHIIAGSLATFTWAASESGHWGTVITGFCIPCLIGNVFGGTLLVAVLNHAQVVSGSPDERL